MKVLKVPDENWSHTTSCTRCGTVVELSVGDVTGWDDQREGATLMWNCPTCRANVMVNASVLPKTLWRKVSWR